MARRKVTHTRKYNGRVIALGNPEEWWSSRATEDVIVDIESGLHRYYVADAAGRIVAVQRVTGRTGQRLHAPGQDGRDLLQRLPDC
jgi:hypothetical protein